ncbi:MAG TPA: hypothetical protein VMX17_11300 [Candidatus Glassbacteria bacterium]|nr:hypothetical protein [Candidatus Glassbacteria bacterium]
MNPTRVDTNWIDTYDKNLKLHTTKWLIGDQSKETQLHLFECETTSRGFFPFPIIGEAIEINY